MLSLLSLAVEFATRTKIAKNITSMSLRSRETAVAISHLSMSLRAEFSAWQSLSFLRLLRRYTPRNDRWYNFRLCKFCRGWCPRYPVMHMQKLTSNILVCRSCRDGHTLSYVGEKKGWKDSPLKGGFRFPL